MNIMNKRFGSEIFEFVEIAFSERIIKKEKKGVIKVSEKNSREWMTLQDYCASRMMHLSQDYFQQIISVINDSSPQLTPVSRNRFL